MTYNIKRTTLLNLLINCILARSALQIWSVKDECTFRFSNSLIIDFCKSFANYWFGKILLLTPLPDNPLKQDLFHINLLSIFSNIKCFIP